MKILISLKAISSKQAQRENLRIYARIELSERRKLTTQRTQFQRSVGKESRIDITCLNVSESSGTTVEASVMEVEEQPQVNIYIKTTTNNYLIIT